MAGQITHYWDGTKLVVTSDSGTSSCDLKGEKGDIGVRGCQGNPGLVPIDDSLTRSGYAADAKSIGDKIAEMEETMGNTVGKLYRIDCYLDSETPYTTVLNLPTNDPENYPHLVACTIVQHKDYIEDYEGENTIPFGFLTFKGSQGWAMKRTGSNVYSVEVYFDRLN